MKGESDQAIVEEMFEFATFIVKLELIDLLVLGVKFTWHKLDRSSMS